jgi:hypothetical protein
VTTNDLFTRSAVTLEPRPTQLGLFGSDELAVGTTFAAVHRIQLDATSWVGHVPGWPTGSEHLLMALVAKAGWEQRSRWMVNRMIVEPRLTAEYTELADTPDPCSVRRLPSCPSTTACRTTGFGSTYIVTIRTAPADTATGPPIKRDIWTVPALSLGGTRCFLHEP